MTQSDGEIYSTYIAQTILYPWWRHLELSRHVSQSRREDGPHSSGSILLNDSGISVFLVDIQTERHCSVVIKVDVKTETKFQKFYCKEKVSP